VSLKSRASERDPLALYADVVRNPRVAMWRPGHYTSLQRDLRQAARFAERILTSLRLNRLPPSHRRRRQPRESRDGR